MSADEVPDPAQYSSVGVRDQTAELASFALSDNNSVFGGITPPEVYSLNQHDSDRDTSSSSSSSNDTRPSKIDEVSEPVTPDVSPREPYRTPHMSALTQMIKSASPSPPQDDIIVTTGDTPESRRAGTAAAVDVSENTPLLARSGSSRVWRSHAGGRDVERQQYTDRLSPSLLRSKLEGTSCNTRSCRYLLNYPKTWNSRIIWRQAILHPLKLLPAVFLGLLLNVLSHTV